jgi:hypothetical protein
LLQLDPTTQAIWYTLINSQTIVCIIVYILFYLFNEDYLAMGSSLTFNKYISMCDAPSLIDNGKSIVEVVLIMEDEKPLEIALNDECSYDLVSITREGKEGNISF